MISLAVKNIPKILGGIVSFSASWLAAHKLSRTGFSMLWVADDESNMPRRKGRDLKCYHWLSDFFD